MKRGFNRLLSLLLTLILVVGLVPAGSISFAAVGDSVVYDFTKQYAAAGTRTWVDQYTEIDLVKNPNWVFFDFSDDFAEVRANTAEFSGLNIRTNVFFGQSFRISNSHDGNHMRNEAWTALRLSVKERGIYDMTFTTADLQGARKANVYVAPYEEGQDDGAYYMTSDNLKLEGAMAVIAEQILRA